MANKIELEVEKGQASAEVKSLTNDLAEATRQANLLTAALREATGAQRNILQGALAGTMGRIGTIQNSLQAAQGSAVIGGSGPAMGLPGAAASYAPTMAFAAGTQPGIGVAPMNPGTGAGQFGASGYTPTLRFGFPTMAMPTMGMMAGQYPLGAAGGQYPTGSMPDPNQTIQFTQAQFAAANYAPGRTATRQVAMGAAYGAARSAGDFFSYQTNRELYGGDDPIARNQGIAGGISAAIGVGVGLATKNPALGLGAAGLANTLLGPIAGWFGGGEAAGQANSIATRGFFGAFYGQEANKPGIRGYSEGGFFGMLDSRFEHLGNFANRRLPSELGFGDKGAGIGAIFGNVAGGLFAGGRNPMEGVGGFSSVDYPLWNATSRNADAALSDASAYARGERGRGSFRLMDALVSGGISRIERAPFSYHDPEETLAGRYTRRLATLFGKEAGDQSKRMGAIFGGLPESGGNVADILTTYGPADTATYLRLQNDRLESSVDPMLLSRVSAGTRAAGRQARLGALQPLRSGAAQQSAYLAQMGNLSLLPEGDRSLAYAEAYSGYRGARAESFEQETLSGFGTRDMLLSEQRKRLDYLPFSPGNRFGLEIASIGNRRGQIGRLGQMLQNTDLSERERYAYMAEREGLISANYQSAGVLAEGFENKLPALAAGRPDFFSKYNSIEGAAINMGRIGSGIRAYGAYGGRQRAGQDAFLSALGGDSAPHSGMPTSRTSEMNNAPLLQEIAGILRQIAGNTSGSHSPQVGHNRPTDNYGHVQGAVNKDIETQQRAAWNSH